MANLSKEDILTAISEMSVMDIVELVKAMEDKFGVSAAVMAAPAAIATSGAAPPVEEQTEFKVVMTSFGSNKVAVIKVAREITGLGLKEAKELVESAPQPIKEGVSKEEAAEIKEKIEAVGGSVELK